MLGAAGGRGRDRGHRLLLDNGADLVAAHVAQGQATPVIGATEETTSGAARLRDELQGRVPFPVIVINDSPLKLIVENEHGVGQTVVEAFMRVTNLMVPGKRCVVLGYGWCGRGIARTLRRLGARVAVVEPDAIRALEAALDGMTVSSLEDLLGWGHAFFTVTGRPRVIRQEHVARMRDGAILANADHFGSEIEIDEIREAAASSASLGTTVQRFTMPGGKTISILAGGEMLNLAGGGGNPAETMDMGLALQARCLELLARGDERLFDGPQSVPHEINHDIAELMLATFR